MAADAVPKACCYVDAGCLTLWEADAVAIEVLPRLQAAVIARADAGAWRLGAVRRSHHWGALHGEGEADNVPT